MSTLGLTRNNASQPSGGSRGTSKDKMPAPSYGGSNKGNTLQIPGKSGSSLSPQKNTAAQKPQNLNSTGGNKNLLVGQPLAQQSRPVTSNTVVQKPADPFQNTTNMQQPPHTSSEQHNAHMQQQPMVGLNMQQPKVGEQRLDSLQQPQGRINHLGSQGHQTNNYGHGAPQIDIQQIDNSQAQPHMNKQMQPPMQNQNMLQMETPMIKHQASEDPSGFSTRKNRQQNWQSLHKVHKKVGAEVYLTGFNPRAPTRSYIMSISQIVNIPQADMTMATIEAVRGTGHLTGKNQNNNSKDMLPQAKPLQEGCKYYVEYYATLYNKTKSMFYGRTYRSSKKLLQKHGSDSLQCTDEDWAFFHTSTSDPNSVLVVECVQVAVDTRGQMGTQKVDKRYASLGFAIIEINNLQRPAGNAANNKMNDQLRDMSVIRIPLLKGSPRNIEQIIRNELNNARRTAQDKNVSVSIEFQLRDFTHFDFLKDLIPQNCFVGQHDKIPGYIQESLPDYKQFLQASMARPENHPTLRRKQKQSFYLQRIKLNIPIKLEEAFIGFLQRMANQQKTDRNHFANSARILERRLLVTVNNTWKDLCPEEHVCALSAPNNLGVSIFSGNLTITDWINHPLVALIFKLEFIAEVPFEGQVKKASFMLGYKVHLPQMTNNMGTGQDQQIMEQDINVELEMGPGFSPNMFTLWPSQELSDQYFNVRMTCNLAIDPNSLKPENDFQKNQPIISPTEQQQIMSHSGMQGAQIRQPQMPQQPGMPIGAGYQGAGMMSGQNQSNFNFNHDPSMFQTSSQQIDPRIQQQHQEEMRIQKIKMEQMQRQNEILMEQQRQAQMNQAQNQIHGGQLAQGYTDPNLQAQINQMQAVIENNNRQMQMMKNENEQMMQRQMNPQMTGYQDQFSKLGPSQELEIARIGNVFYNMLNIIGENEKDRRILGLSSELKTLMQQRHFDDLLAPKVPYVSQNQVNLMKVTDLPIQDHANFIKAGYGDALMNPSAQINTGIVGKDNLSLQKEESDPLSSSTISFKFICFKTPWQSLEKIPDRFYFQFKFFTFPLLLTDKVRIKHEKPQFDQDDGRPHVEPGLKGGFPYYLEKDRLSKGELMTDQRLTTNHLDTQSAPELISAEFTIDPSVSKILNEHVRLAEYMRERFLVVDIFDGDSLFLYGSCKIPLFELMRQQKPVVVRAKEAELCDPHSGESRGAIQFIMTNTGKVPSVVESTEEKNKTKTLNQDLSGDVKRMSPERKIQPNQKDHKNKKVIKSNPIQASSFAQPEANVSGLVQNQMGLGYTDPSFKQKSLGGDLTKEELAIINSQNAEMRKKLRVDRMRKKNLGGPNAASMLDIEDPMQNDWQKIRSLQQIEMIRNSKKDQILQQVLSDYTSDVQKLYVQPGKQEFFTIPLNNYYQNREVFSVIIKDPEADVAKELSLVNDQAEWRYWAAEGKCLRPPSFDLITPNNDVVLEANQTVELLFKFSTLRDCLTHFQAANKIQEVKTQIVPRKIQICIFESKSRPHLVMDVQIIPSSAPIDQTFRYYEPENSHVSITIPPFAQLNYPGIQAVLSDSSASIEVDHETNYITIETNTKAAPEIQAMTLFIYGDQFKEHVKATIRIEIYSMVAMFTKVRAGVGQEMSLSLPMDRARVVQLYSEDFRQVYLPQRKNDTKYRLIPSSVNHLNIVAKMTQVGSTKVRMHCVDVNTGELVHAWLLNIESTKPKSNIVHEVNLKMNSSQSETLQYQNRLPNSAVFEFCSSNPKIMVPKEEVMAIEGRHVKNVVLQFFPRKRYGQEEVYLFISDTEQKIVECMLLKLMIIP